MLRSSTRKPQVDKTKKIGAQGYCMGGALVVRTAAGVPDRIGAGASFHGGGLVIDKPDSPHLRQGAGRARVGQAYRVVQGAGIEVSRAPVSPDIGGQLIIAAPGVHAADLQGANRECISHRMCRAADCCRR